MAQERSDVEKFAREDAADYTLGKTPTSRALSAPDENGATEQRGDATGDLDTSMETENIKGQIEETRMQMGETIDAIQDKLSFSNISEQVSDHVHNAVDTAREAVYDATIGKAANIMKNLTDDISHSTMYKTAKDNPLPFILIGAGAGLLAYKGLSGTLTPRKERGDMARYRYPQSRSLQTPESPQRSTLGQLGETVSTKAEHAVDKVSTAFDSVYTEAGAIVDRASESMDHMRSTAVDKYHTYLNDNPLALGAAALAVGAAVGMAIPTTVYEGQLLGKTRDDILGKAQDSATGLLDKTKQAIVDTGTPVTNQKGSMKEH